MLPGQKFTPDEILSILRQRWWLLLIPTVIVSIGVVFYTRSIPDVYRSETMILVVPQRVPESYVRSTVTARIEDRLQSIQQQIFSRSRLERIILDFDLYKTERQNAVMEDIVSRMRENIEVAIERGDSFRVRYLNGNPRLAQRVTERLASLFIEENLREREVLAEGTNQFLEAQLEDARQRLIEQEKRLEQYRRQHAGELPTQTQGNLQMVANLQMQVQSVVDAMARDRERRPLLERQIAELQSTEDSMIPVAAAAAAPAPSTADRLDAARNQLRLLELRYKPEHPDVSTARRLVRDLEAKVAATELAEGTVPAPQEASRAASVDRRAAQRLARIAEIRDELYGLDAQIARRANEEERLRAQIGAYQARVDAAPTRETELVELTRDYATLQGLYTGLLSKREDSKISANLERRQIGEQFKVLDPARVPEKPYSPDRLRLNLIGIAAGFGLGAALIALVEYRDMSLRTAAHVLQVVNLPVLALVPLMRSARERRQRRRRWLAATALLLVIVGGGGAFAVWKLQLL